MAFIHFISSYQCNKLLLMPGKDFVKKLISDKLIEYVRDDEKIYRISLNSVLEFASNYHHRYDKAYLRALREKLKPWCETDSDSPVIIIEQPAVETVDVDQGFRGMGFSRRALNVFIDNGILTPKQLTEFSASDLMKLNNFGRKTLKETRSILEKYNLSLKKYTPGQPAKSFYE